MRLRQETRTWYVLVSRAYVYKYVNNIRFELFHIQEVEHRRVQEVVAGSSGEQADRNYIGICIEKWVLGYYPKGHIEIVGRAV